jgi:hypothetical protein
MGLHRTAFKIGTLLNGKRLVMDIADDMRLRLENHVSALNGAFDSPVHNHPLGLYSRGDMGFARDNERSTVQLALDLPVDLD